MVRVPTSITAALVTTAADTQAISAGDHAGGIISIPTGSSITALTFYVSDSQGGTYLQL
jgi:hypothetical protein